MAALDTYRGFKEWAFGLLLVGNIGMQVTVNKTVSELNTNVAVISVLYEELKRSHQELKADFTALKEEQRQHEKEADKELTRIQEYLRPNETRAQRKTSDR